MAAHTLNPKEFEVPEDMFFDAWISFLKTKRDFSAAEDTAEHQKEKDVARLQIRLYVWILKWWNWLFSTSMTLPYFKHYVHTLLKVFYQAFCCCIVLFVIYTAFGATKSEGLIGSIQLEEPTKFSIPISCERLQQLPNDVDDVEMIGNAGFFLYGFHETADRVVVSDENVLFDDWNDNMTNANSSILMQCQSVSTKYPCQVLDATDEDGKSRSPGEILKKLRKQIGYCFSRQDEGNATLSQTVTPLTLTAQNTLETGAKYLVWQMFGINCVLGSIIPKLLTSMLSCTLLRDACPYSWKSGDCNGWMASGLWYSVWLVMLVSAIAWYVLIPAWIVQLSVIVIIECADVFDIIKDCLALGFLNEVVVLLRFMRTTDHYRVKDFKGNVDDCKDWSEYATHQVFIVLMLLMNYYLIVVVYCGRVLIDPSVGLNPAKHPAGFFFGFYFIGFMGSFWRFRWVELEIKEQLRVDFPHLVVIVSSPGLVFAALRHYLLSAACLTAALFVPIVYSECAIKYRQRQQAMANGNGNRKCCCLCV